MLRYNDKKESQFLNVESDHAYQLLQGFLVRDQALSREFFSRFAVYLDVVFRCLGVRCADERQDLSSHVFEKVLVNGVRFDPAKGAVSSWLAAIARRHLLDIRRKQATRRAVSLSEEGESEYSGRSPWDDIDEQDFPLRVASSKGFAGCSLPDLDSLITNETVSKLIDHLGDDILGETLNLGMRGNSQRGIAYSTSIPLGTVKSRMNSSLERLREAFTN